MEAQEVALTQEQCAELQDLLIHQLQANSNKLGEWAVILALVKPGRGYMRVKIFDHNVARALAQVMEG